MTIIPRYRRAYANDFLQAAPLTDATLALKHPVKQSFLGKKRPSRAEK